MTIVVCAALTAVGYVESRNLKIGVFDPGAPELRPDSRYNRDAAFMTANYGASSDVLAVMVETPDGSCALYDTLMREDALDWTLRQVDPTRGSVTLPMQRKSPITKTEY